MELMLQRAWQRRGLLATALLPLALLFRLFSSLRRLSFRFGWSATQRLPVPVVIVGNITAGGAGKTPLCLWLVAELRRHGRHPGIVSRGYGGTCGDSVCEVLTDASAQQVGDEPLLLRRRAGCPVFVGRDRVAAARALLKAYPDCDVIVGDDGLQHYRLARDVEVAVLDNRLLGNGWLLPAGPLREPAERLRSVDAVVLNGFARVGLPSAPGFRMQLDGALFHRLDDPRQICPADALRDLRLHACAGIGAPQRFFDQLSGLGLHFSPHAFPDHHRYVAADLVFADCDALLMTEKDAIKCVDVTLSQCPVWVLPVTASVEPGLAELILEKIDGRSSA
jgi:tetraacyldisaccharide 4'-kinase